MKLMEESLWNVLGSVLETGMKAHVPATTCTTPWFGQPRKCTQEGGLQCTPSLTTPECGTSDRSNSRTGTWVKNSISGSTTPTRTPPRSSRHQITSSFAVSTKHFLKFSFSLLISAQVSSDCLILGGRWFALNEICKFSIAGIFGESGAPIGSPAPAPWSWWWWTYQWILAEQATQQIMVFHDSMLQCIWFLYDLVIRVRRRRICKRVVLPPLLHLSFLVTAQVTILVDSR